MERLKGAISFLTILPIRSNIEDEKEFSKIMAFFPIVALILGIIYCSISNLVYNFADSLFFSSVIYLLGSLQEDFIMTVLLILVTGCFPAEKKIRF